MEKHTPETTRRRGQPNAQPEFTPGGKTEAGLLAESPHQAQFPSSIAPPALQLKVSPIQAMGISFGQLPEKSSDIQELHLEQGTAYTITADDMAQGSDELIWKHIARNHGMLPEKLQLFNDRVLKLELWGFTHYGPRNSPALKEGGTLYIPSADELSFLAFREQFRTYHDAVQEYGKFINSKNQKILRKGFKRASGEIGESYGTQEEEFYSPNKGLAGVSRRNSADINGQREYRINWSGQGGGGGYWKCNIFMHDVVYDAGYVPHLASNKHYPTAGRLHESKHFKKLKVSEVKPGTLVQLYGGTGQDDSHNMVLSSFVKRVPQKNGRELWSFDAIGAENDRSAESTRQHEVDPDESGDFYKVTDGGRQFIRFFEPQKAR